MTAQSVPFFRPAIGRVEIDAVGAALESGWLTSGPRVADFEKAFAEKVGATHALATNSCTAALHLSLAALDLDPGDEVIVPTMTFAATASAVVHAGGVPVLADSTADTLHIDPADVERKITPRTRAVIPMHYGGQPVDMQEILQLARDYGLAVVEDAAHAFPARDGTRTIGGISDSTCFSFYANKTITTGEGGMVTTNDEVMAAKMKLLRDHGLQRQHLPGAVEQRSWSYAVEVAGYKYNMPEMAGALGLAQLARADEMRVERQRQAVAYRNELTSVDGIRPLRERPDILHAWHLFVVALDIERLTIDRDVFAHRLKEQGVSTSYHYYPLHLHPYFEKELGTTPHDNPTATDMGRRIVSLPLFPGMTDAERGTVLDVLTSTFEAHTR